MQLSNKHLKHSENNSLVAVVNEVSVAVSCCDDFRCRLPSADSTTGDIDWRNCDDLMQLGRF